MLWLGGGVILPGQQAGLLSLITMGSGGQAWLSKTSNILDILLYPVSTIGPTMIGAEENFSK